MRCHGSSEASAFLGGSGLCCFWGSRVFALCLRWGDTQSAVLLTWRPPRYLSPMGGRSERLACQLPSLRPPCVRFHSDLRPACRVNSKVKSAVLDAIHAAGGLQGMSDKLISVAMSTLASIRATAPGSDPQGAGAGAEEPDPLLVCDEDVEELPPAGAGGGGEREEGREQQQVEVDPETEAVEGAVLSALRVVIREVVQAALAGRGVARVQVRGVMCPAAVSWSPGMPRCGAMIAREHMWRKERDAVLCGPSMQDGEDGAGLWCSESTGGGLEDDGWAGEVQGPMSGRRQ